MRCFATYRRSSVYRQIAFYSPLTDSAEAQGKGTYFDLMRRAFISKAASLGYEVIDLDPRFFEHYAAHAQRFEYPHDGHWNEIGHAVASKAVLESRLVGRLADRQP